MQCARLISERCAELGEPHQGVRHSRSNDVCCEIVAENPSPHEYIEREENHLQWIPWPLPGTTKNGGAVNRHREISSDGRDSNAR